MFVFTQFWSDVLGDLMRLKLVCFSVLWLGSFRFFGFYFMLKVAVLGGFRVYYTCFCWRVGCGVGFVFGRARLVFMLWAFLLVENERSVCARLVG